MKLKKFWKRPEFLSLKQEWYHKLHQSGFVDHEESIGGEDRLKQNAPNSYKQACTIERESKLDYYLLLSEGIELNQFDDDIDKFIMVRISEGIKLRQISKELYALGCIRWHRQSVMFVKRKYENRWGIRKWKPEQLQTLPPKFFKKKLLTV